MGESSAQSFCLKILVAKDENRVIMAGSDKDFIEVLFSFMTMPIASAVWCTRNCLSGEIGCLSNLYESVENLDMNFLEDKSFQNILLNPRSAAEIYCKDLGMNLIERGRYDFYVCHNKECKVISYYKIGKCRCGEALKHRLEMAPGSWFFPEVKGGFLKSTARFIITDDFKVMPVATMADLTVLSELGKYGKVEERTVKVGKFEVLNLLKRSLISKTPLSETFLRPSIDKSDIEHLNMKYGPGGMDPCVKVMDFWNGNPKICLKLIFDKVNDIVLYAVVEEDFVNLLCTFLTFPLGYIFNQFPCLSFEGCMGNLHKSIQGADINIFSHEERKEMLVYPKLSPGLAYTNNLIGIEEATIPSYSTFSSLFDAKSKILRSNPNSGNQKVFDGFIKGPATFLVMDNLEVKPLSPISVKLLSDKLMVPLSDIGEQEVILDNNKAMRLLAASLASKHALTSTFLHKKTNVDCFCLKILVAKDENRVIMAESDKDFIEVLFSFMTMPIASAVWCTRNCLSGEIGCLSNLYESVENLDMNFLEDKSFQNILLNPRSAAEIYCKDLGMNLIERGRNDFYVCHNKECKVISYYKIDKCRCGEALKHRLEMAPGSRFFPEVKGGFLKSTARFIITDDFKVMPVATMADLTVLSELGKDGKVEERTVKVGKDEVLKLLKCSLISKTPLSETFLEPSIDKSNNELLNMKYGPGGMDPRVKVMDFWNGKPKICLKLIFDKVNDIVLYAVVEEDFVNLLCTFLTFPLGYIFNQFPCLSFEGCMGNLHKSIQGADINIFSHEERKEMLVNPKLSPGLAYTSNLIGIQEATIPLYSCFSALLDAKCKTLTSNPNSGNQKVFDGFIKGPATFLVMDNLEVKPLSPISVKLLVDKLMVPLSDIGEQEVILDNNKAMRLLAASLASKHALTSTFLHKETNVDCLDFLRLIWGGKRIGHKGY